MEHKIQPLASSFRDPSGFVFQKNGTIYRQVNSIFKEDFDLFINSGCYDHFVKNRWLIPHEEVTGNLTGTANYYKTLKPEKIPFISYAYEWSFDMLKDAALLTLQLAKEGLSYGVLLKDATHFNIQWLHGKPVFIDTLSFEKYDAAKPWIAYRQFCENFLSPLLLMHYTQQPVQSLLTIYPEGIPLSMTRSLLTWKSKFSFHTFLHIHLQDRLASKKIGKESAEQNSFSEKKLLRLFNSLQSLITSLQWKNKPTVWGNYYEEANERNNYIEQKKNIISKWISEMHFLKTAVDLGANEGAFSFLLSQKNIQAVAIDFDPNAINKLYKKIKKENEKNILPLIIDLSNPSPAIGFNNSERVSFLNRTDVDMVFALALLHHLCIGKNIPFEKIAALFQQMTNYLIIEFVPKEDEKIQLMLRQKKDIYSDYTTENFEKTFKHYFEIIKKESTGDSGRIIYLMKNNSNN
jgi:hypothetical protein